MTDASPSEPSVKAARTAATGILVLENGQVFYGQGLGAVGTAVGELVFNTAMTGYQEVLTDPSYAGQIVTFTFPHIGNTGANAEDIEDDGVDTTAVRGAVFRMDVSEPSSWRATRRLQAWLEGHGIAALCGVDTRRLVSLLRDCGAMKAVIAHDLEGCFDTEALVRQAQEWSGLEGQDLAKDVTCTKSHGWDETLWKHSSGYGRSHDAECHIAVVDFGIKRNIMRALASAGCRLSVVPADTSAKDILALAPDGVFLSNGPGDPAATGSYAVPMIQELLKSDLPIFGICLGHQMLGLALGAKTVKMHHGHHGANHPVQDHETGKVEITSQNHGFAIDATSLPDGVVETHTSLFDGTNQGIRVKDQPIFSVQFHPEASPGPHDTHHLFHRFTDMCNAGAGKSL